MLVDTVINIGDTLFVVDQGRILSRKVDHIKIIVYSDGRIAKNYQTRDLKWFSTFYRTREEAGIEILKQNGLDVGLITKEIK